MSHMRTTMETQPGELARLVGDDGPARAAAERVAGRRTWLVGIGTSWHAAHHGAWLLADAGVDARALHAADAAQYGWRPDAGDAVVVLSHTGKTGYTREALEAARAVGAAVVHVTAIGNGGDLETVTPETSYAYTASHTAALMRLAQMAVALGADLGDLAAVPDAVAGVLSAPGPVVEPPRRLLELMGAGPNGWTAAEGALKVREASYVATEGLSSEQFLHGPSVALDDQDTLVVLDGGGPGAGRTEAIAGAMEVTGTRVVRLSERDLGEPLSVFALTVWVQRIALELSEAHGVSPDRFRYEEDPARQQAIESLGF
jgi:glutamine---fructose-6-phosphate transaminase (isomerizing)